MILYHIFLEKLSLLELINQWYKNIKSFVSCTFKNIWFLCYWQRLVENASILTYSSDKDGAGSWVILSVAAKRRGYDRMRTLISQIKMSHGRLPSDSEVEKNKSQGHKNVTIWTNCQASSKEVFQDNFYISRIREIQLNEPFLRLPEIK